MEVADIFRHHGAAYRQRHALLPEQRATMRAIETCRTAARGGHLDVCDACGHTRPAYNSCRNRHCPKCEALREARWIEARMARLLPSHYFHVVFTLPAELRPLALRHRRRLFALLFRAASRTLLTLGLDPRRLGARLGVTAVLHTWTRDLQFHPHLHCLVTGGGLAADGTRWIRARPHHLLPVRVLSRLFRGKFLAALTREYTAGRLDLTGACAELADPRAFVRLKQQLYRHDWVIYAKRPFAGAPQVFRYLGRYTHRVGLSNHRLLAADDTGVRFATKLGRSVRLPPDEFIRRFLLHVLPARFVKIRHFGLFAPGRAMAAHRERARRLLAAPPVPTRHEDWRTLFRRLTGIDLTRCPRCRRGTMIATPLPPRAPFAHDRAPPMPAVACAASRHRSPSIPRSPRAIVLRDSFAGALIPFLSEHFARVLYLFTEDLDPVVVERERPGVVIEEFVERRLMRGAPANRPELARAETPDGPRGGRRRRAVGDVPLTVAGVLRPRPRMLRIGTLIAPYDRMLRLALLGLVTTWLTTLVRLMRSSRAAVPAPAEERALPQRRA